MRVARLVIERFRCIKSSELHFDGHSLLIGTNNVGKSTVCEALDLVLGPDRLSKFPPVEEYDFYNSEYLDRDTSEPIPLSVEVVLTDLNDEVAGACSKYIEFWHKEERRLLGEGEIDKANPPHVEKCLRIKTIASYSLEEDEFEANTYYCHSPDAKEDELDKVWKNTKRLFGFLYLRTLRTGRRALSLERGSLLDIILKMQGVRTGLWENTIERLKNLDPPIDVEEESLSTILGNIEERLGQYIQSVSGERTAKLFVSQLTREHLRQTIAFFLSSSQDQTPTPYLKSGSGTLNALVLALLSFIADVKKDVIFAMEEPEIALPPHTQRRIANYLLQSTSQCFVTSHSPYIIERFSQRQLSILRRNIDGKLSITPVSQGSSLKEKTYRRHARRGLSEAMLGNAVIIAEGFTEFDVLKALSMKMEDDNSNLMPLDLSGITIITADGDGSILEFGRFFNELNIKTYAFYDKMNRSKDELKELNDTFNYPYETAYKGTEKLLIEEIPTDKQWKFLELLRAEDTKYSKHVPEDRPDDEDVSKLLFKILKRAKGDGLAGRLIDLCPLDECPESVIEFLETLYNDFQKPDPIKLPSFDDAEDDE
ncbi:ATP-dependent endonuclease [Oceanidesulfovibrio indonesiensis]|uniref:ATP-dependent endonuclease n=1 Tax=Oceanidesulfovibrio indonesiensis TaxID=54767 RepID=A0A7M3MA31_9BACT|nr:AAA family ATPase [Oceanidesulfovibrio indonesiensis]TVM14221.1 ATP-dependent endonuclease [Oceanidesulfovibrio indonesiensis]